MNAKLERFLQYGVSSDLAIKAESAGLTVSKVRTLSQRDMVSKFFLTKQEAKELAQAVKRQPIEEEIIDLLLTRSNYICSVCKGQKGKSYVIHHISPYEQSQDNTYDNLIVLCPNDHDLAHQSGLSMRITPEQLKKEKTKWEKQVEIANYQRAASAIEVNDGAIDYINVRRIEELCLDLFGSIPNTQQTEQLKARHILGPSGVFDQPYVSRHMSGGRYLFDYINSGETQHYKQLLTHISTRVTFVDLDPALSKGLGELEKLQGRYVYFVGGVHAKRPKTPITVDTPAITMHYTRRGARVEWHIDPMFLYSMSAISRMGLKNRYIVYSHVRSVTGTNDKVLVQASPLLIAQPSAYPDRTPAIAYQRQYDDYVERGWIQLNEDE